MALFKCKICGGSLDIAEGSTVAVCDYCGTKQTVPTTKDDAVANLFNRANNLRMKCEFDRAEQIYEKILDIDNSDAEAHWGMVLCKYGIEYVEDKKTDSKIPTCHRTLYEAILTDVDYLAATENADAAQKELYEAEAQVIDGLQKRILNIVNSEEPFDVFICYKETDESGKRTLDSSLSNDIYYQLTREGFKVFYAPITLENKLGYEYEPYIFAALNSAKVMLVVGTRPEYFDAVWVRNEWSRYLKLMKNERSKLLIPCYRDMDPYELPDEFAHLQAQDMSKIGFMQDLLRGITKVVSADSSAKETTVVKETVISSGSTNTEPLLKRVFMFLEDGEWAQAKEYCEKVLDMEPENALAYLGKLMAELKVKTRENLKNCKEPFDNSTNYQKAIRFADSSLKEELENCVSFIKERNEEERLSNLYADAKSLFDSAKAEGDYIAAKRRFEVIKDYKDSAALAKKCEEKAQEVRKEAQRQAEIARKISIYNNACDLLSDSHQWQGKKTDIKAYEDAIVQLQSLDGWKDSEEKILECERKINEKKKKQVEECNQEEELTENKRREKVTVIGLFIVLGIMAIVIFISLASNTFMITNHEYNEALELMNVGEYGEAIYTFRSLGDYKDGNAHMYNYCQCDVEDWKLGVKYDLDK